MKVREVAYHLGELEQFEPNDFFKQNKQEIIIDFERIFTTFLEIELPEGLGEQQLASVTRQKTDLLIAFVSGHLNFFDPQAKVFKKINEQLGDNTPSGLILPKKKLIV